MTNRNLIYLLVSLPFITHCGDKNNETADTADVTDSETTGMMDCASMCDLALSCDDIQDKDLIFSTDNTSCEAACANDMSWSMSQCSRSASSCEDISECTRHSVQTDDAICVPGCELVVNTCGLSSDINQCNIDCNMVMGGFAGAYYGADLMCWEAAIENQDCDQAQQCQPIYY